MALTKATYAMIQGAPINILDKGADNTGVADCYPALQTALAELSAAGGGCLYFPTGTYLIGTAFQIPNNVTFQGDGKRTSILKRGFTGDFITSFGGYCSLLNIGIDGQTATFGAGRGVLMSGSTPNSLMFNTVIENFVESCLEFATDSGSTFRAIGCSFYTTGTVGSVGAVKIAGVDTVATSRHFIGCESGGCTLFNINGCNDMYVVGGYSNGLITTANTNKLMITNMRFGSSAGPYTINGAQSRYVNCVFAESVTFAAINSDFQCEVPDYNINDTGTGNTIFTKSVAYTPTWTAASANPSIGNGSIKSLTVRDGSLITVFYDIAFGTTTTFGTGDWSFSLPRIDYDNGTVMVNGGGFTQVASGSNVQFQCRVTPSGQKVQLFYVDAGVLKTVGSTTNTWGNGDVIRFSLSYITK